MTIKDSYILAKCQDLELLITEAKQWATGNDKLGAHLATYIDVMILGMLEVCVEYLVTERAKRSGDAEVSNYIGKHIEDRFKNPNFGLICWVLGLFSDAYRAEFEKTFKADSSEVTALNGLLENKTNVAHNGLANLNLSVSDVESYFNGVVRVLEKLEELLL